MVGFVGAAVAASPAWGADGIDYTTQVAPLLTKYCAGCHNDQDREGKLSLASFAALQRGGDHGAVLVPGQAAASRLIQLLTTTDAEKKMPPKDEAQPSAEEVALLTTWVNAGARGPAGEVPDRRMLATPQIKAAPASERRVVSLEHSPDGKLLAIGRYGSVELRPAGAEPSDPGHSARTISGLPGKVQAVHFSSDGKLLVTAAGIPGVYGVATLWNVVDGAKVREFEGHSDALFDAELSPTGSVLATCGYDRRVILWNRDTGEKLRVLEGHNDAVYDVAFSPDGAFLASASGDKTVKVWRVADGERLDTLSQPQGEQYVTLFSPDGQFILAGGADNRIRVWRLISTDQPRINPLVYARFAHEGAVNGLAFSPDGKQLASAAEDRTVKRWETATYTELELLPKQPDQVAEVSLRGGPNQLLVASVQGELTTYPAPLTAGGSTASASQAIAVTPMDAATPLQELAESEPNDQLSSAQGIPLPAKVKGRIHNAERTSDVDLYRITAQAGQEWVLEINASRQKSPLDSRVEVLDPQGKPVPRLLLQAVRDSYFTFRGKDSDTSDDFRVFNWEEMELNELLYANGEVVKLWHYPRGPDSGYIVYPGRGKRQTRFDTTPLSHALGEPCYIVEPHAADAKLIPNGLPTFLLYYENDDDAWRQWGSDSRLHFVAPTSGEYLVRVTDSRGFQGEAYQYDLLVRPAKPDFQIRVEGANPTIAAGSGKEFSLNVERLDGFEGEIQVDVEGLPPGFHASTPIRVQEGQTLALGVVNAAPDAPAPTPEQAKGIKLVASAKIQGQDVKKEIGGLGEIKLGPKPKVLVRLVAANAPAGGDVDGMTPWQKPLELVLEPGQTISAKVRIERNDFKDRVQFGGFDSGRNLPYGSYVDNIGLNGLMIVEGQTEREFFITAAKGVPEQTRLFHLQSQVDGNQASWPVVLHIKRKSP